MQIVFFFHSDSYFYENSEKLKKSKDNKLYTLLQSS